MKGIVKKIELKECQTKDKKNKFRVLEFTCDVTLNDKGEIKTLRGSWGEEYAKKYLAYLGMKSKELIGKEVDCTIAKRQYEKEGETRTINFIKYMNLIDKDGNPIYLPKEEEDLDF